MGYKNFRREYEIKMIWKRLGNLNLRNIFIALSPIIYIISYLIPKKSKRICFGEWFGRSHVDSPYFIYKKFSVDQAYESFWITKTEAEYIKLNVEHRCVYAYSLIGIWYQITAKNFISSVSSRDFAAFCLTPKANYIQLCHGMPIKGGAYEKYSKFQKVRKYVRDRSVDNYSYVGSAAQFFDEVITKQYNISPDRLIRVPLARCDELVISKSKESEIKERFKVSSDKVVVSYLPTHRDEGRTADVIAVALFKIDLALKLNSNLRRKIEFIVSPHHYDREHIKRLKDLQFVKVNNGHASTLELLSITDLFIGDYSGVIYDFSYLDRPAICYCPDFKRYTQVNRSLYYKLSDIYKLVIDDEEQLIEAIKQFSVNEKKKDKALVPVKIFPQNHMPGNLTDIAYDTIRKLIQ
jgi:CDP-glycerol glycerophosphotransferase (TagB/SpsB family)